MEYSVLLLASLLVIVLTHPPVARRPPAEGDEA
jgi:hypothetical protein